MKRILSVTLLLLLTTAFPWAACRGEGTWQLQFFHDEDESEFIINDLVFTTPERGIAAGYLSENGRERSRVLVTRNGGKDWSFVSTRETGISLFFINESLGWMVTSNGGLWRTEEAGLSWNRVARLRGAVRVYFLDEMHGWAVGINKNIYETVDGGAHWKPLPVAREPKTNANNTTYGWIEFADPDFGLIIGWSIPPRRNNRRFPDWMDPEQFQNRRQWPSLSIEIRTTDGGKTWTPKTTSMFGMITRLRSGSSGEGLALVEFRDAFEWPSEVYHLNFVTGETERVYREKDRAVTDIALVDNGLTYLAGVEASGTLRRSPIPGRLVILRGKQQGEWEEMEIDYRAYAHRAIIASVDSSNIWVATDTGMILKLAAD